MAARPARAIATGYHRGRRRFYTLAAVGAAAPELHYTFHQGYWLLAPDRLALKDAVRTKESGMTLATSAQLRGALPVDGQGQYSALVYLNAGTLTGALGAAVPGGMDAGAKAGIDELKELLANQSAMAFCVTAERDRVVLTSTGFDLLEPGRILAAMARGQLAAPEGKVRPRVVKGAGVVI